MKWKKNTKRGSILVEAALVLPVFILSVIMLSSLIPVTGICENAFFSACDELRTEALKVNFRKNPVAVSSAVSRRIKEENKDVTGCRIYSTDYLYSKKGIKDLITVKGTVIIEKNSLFNLYGKTEYDLHLTGRGFTGKKERKEPLPRSEFERKKGAEPVCIFPSYGKKYHKKDCSYVKGAWEKVMLNDTVRKKYSPCSLCHSETAATGTPVCIFRKEGEHYHLQSCKQVSRACIEIEKEDAVKKGYSPCYKCGG